MWEGGGGVCPQPPPVQHPLGWCDGCHRTMSPVRSPHTSYWWRGERVIEPIKWMEIIRRLWLTRAQWREFGQDTRVTPLLFTRSAMGFLMTAESQDLGLTSHPKDGAFWQYSRFLPRLSSAPTHLRLVRWWSSGPNIRWKLRLCWWLSPLQCVSCHSYYHALQWAWFALVLKLLSSSLHWWMQPASFVHFLWSNIPVKSGAYCAFDLCLMCGCVLIYVLFTLLVDLILHCMYCRLIKCDSRDVWPLING